LDAISWEQARDAHRADQADVDFRLPSPRIRPSTAVRDYARPSFSAGRPLGQCLLELITRIHADFTYKAGATTVRTSVPDVLRKREGVCQDFAHLTVSCLRSMGLPARYVSGYLETDPPAGQAKLQGADASHAWAAVLVPDAGWVDLDPTNRQFVDNRYVVLAWGRDYDDVPPLKGVILTDAKQSTMDVSVDLVRLP
jgi:transglutaminase-like putative cysteine protease